MENNKIEKLVLKLTKKSYAQELKKDMVTAGVPKKNIELMVDESNNCIMNINDVYNHMPTIINMFRDEPYNMSLDEISKLLHIKLV